MRKRRQKFWRHWDLKARASFWKNWNPTRYRFPFSPLKGENFLLYMEIISQRIQTSPLFIPWSEKVNQARQGRLSYLKAARVGQGSDRGAEEVPPNPAGQAATLKIMNKNVILQALFLANRVPAPVRELHFMSHTDTILGWTGLVFRKISVIPARNSTSMSNSVTLLLCTTQD